MDNVPGYKKAQQQIGDFTLHEFRLLQKLTLEVVQANNDEYIQQIDLHLKTDLRNPEASIHIRCAGVRGLKIQDMRSGQVFIEGLDVVDLSTSQQEGVSWQIFDYEDGMINFYCKTLDIIFVESDL